MNILEEEDFIKGLPDSVLMEEAQRPTGTLTQYVVMSEIQRRSKMRKEHEAQLAQGPQSTVKDQIIQEGIMGAMPPQMAMAPQMAQRMPNMPPQGIQQAMPTQMMSGGGIVRMATGGMGADNSQQMLRGLLVAGLTDAQLAQSGYSEEDIARARAGLKETYKMTVDTPDYMGGPMREIEDATRIPASGTQYDPAFIPGVTDEVTEFVTETVPDAARGFIQAGDMARARTGVYGGVNTDFFTPQQRKSISDFIGDTGEQLSGIASAYTGAAETMSQLPSYLYGKATDLYDTYQKEGLAGLLPFQDQLKETPGFESGRDRMVALEDQAAQGAIGTPIDPQSGTGSAPAVQLDNRNVLTDAQVLANLGEGELVANDYSNTKYLDTGNDGVRRAGGDDAMLLDGPERASGALEELKDMINRQSKFSSSTNRGAALVALGTGIIEGKTAQGGKEAAKILSDDAKTQGALQLEGAKIAAADERERNRLAVMREDLQNKLGISQNASNRTALAEVNRALAEYDGFTIRGLADKIAKGMPLTPEESMYMTLQKAQQMLIPIVAPATRSLFANAGNRQQPPPTGGGVVDLSQFDPAKRRT